MVSNDESNIENKMDQASEQINKLTKKVLTIHSVPPEFFEQYTDLANKEYNGNYYGLLKVLWEVYHAVKCDKQNK